nr:resuscitation-promoting factor [Cellulomonas sp. APG4]
MQIGALATALALVSGGSLAYAAAHKTVTLDVDGEVTQVTTFAGSVAGVITAEGLEIGTRDVVAPEPGAGLRDGDEIVVRHARQVEVLTDGEQEHLWTTALSADDVLASLAERGDDVRLVASRSAADGRAELGLRLAVDGPVQVVADGQTHAVDDGSVGLATVLTDLGIEVGELDRVTVVRPEGDTPLTVQVQRVVAEEVVTTTAIPFEKTSEKTDELYKGQSEVAVEGVEGTRETVHRVVTVDGAEESRLLLSDTVTTEPVTQVTHVGTKARPAPRPTTSSSSSSSSGGSSSVGGDVWAALAQCESGGNPSIVSSNGLYHGLYQFSVGTWQSVGGSGLPSQASPAEQTKRAKMLQARSGWGQWPACSSKLGLR